MPMVSCLSIMKAIFNLVPTPSVELTSTGRSMSGDTLEGKEPAETADLAHDPGCGGLLGDIPMALTKCIGLVDVDTGIGIGQRLRHAAVS